MYSISIMPDAPLERNAQGSTPTPYKNHVAGQQFEAQRSATAAAAPDHAHNRAQDYRNDDIRHDAPNATGPSGASGRAGDTPGGNHTAGHDGHSDNADRRTRRRLAGASALTDDTAASLPGSLPSSSPVAPSPAPSAVVPVVLAPAHDQATAHAGGGNTSVLTLSGTRHGTDGNGTSAEPLTMALAGAGSAGAPDMPAPSGAGPGAQ